MRLYLPSKLSLVSPVRLIELMSIGGCDFDRLPGGTSTAAKAGAARPGISRRTRRRAGKARQRRGVGKRRRGILVDKARQRLLAPAHPVDQSERGLAEEADPFRDAGERGRNRRLPGAGQDQRGSIAPGPQFRRERPLTGHCKPAAWQVRNDPRADARHVIDQGRAERGDQQVDRPVRPARLEHAHHRMAADEVADPHIGNDQDRPGVGGILDRSPMS